MIVSQIKFAPLTWMTGCLSLGLLLLGLTLAPALAWGEPAMVALTANQLFDLHCAGCHPHGGNIIRRGKTLKAKALQRNELSSVEAIAELIAQGKGNMTAYGDRLTADEIQQLANYVKHQADRGW